MGTAMPPRPQPAGPAFDVLGPLEVHLDGSRLVVPAGTQRALLAMLLLGRGRAVTAERLYDALWADGPPQDPRASLHTAVARLRRTLGRAGESLRTVAPGYVLDLTAGAVDADRFTDLHARGRAALASGRPAEAVAALRPALALWRGQAWGEFAEGVASGEALRLEEARLAAREDLAAALLEAAEFADAVGLLEQLVHEQPLRDRAVALLVDGLHRYGRTADALSAYGRYRERLADDLGLDPSPTLTALHQRVLRQELPPHAVPVHPVCAAPAAVSPLVGRDEDADALAALVDGGGVVTLVGPGGVGKTRLAQHMAAASGRAVGWVDLVPVRDRAGVVQALADALGLEGPPAQAVRAVLRNGLTEEPGLLVLDNCEHVLDEVATVLVDGGPVAGTVLATSRERLGVPGERVLPLGPLALPPTGEADPHASAVVLFLARAREAGVDLGDDAAAVRRVGDVCRSLDGLPLALELAAARIGTLSLDDLADRLDRRFDLLTRGPRTGPSRHRTLRSVVDWSYDLLDDVERQVFTQLAVFPAGFDLSAAETLLGERVVPTAAVADVVAQLAARSMLVRPPATGKGRYRMLETLRRYALSRLPAEDLAAARRRHASWALDVADAARSGLAGADEAHWNAVLDDVLDDLRAAWRWARDAAEPACAERLLGATWRWAYSRLRTDLLGWGGQLVDDRPEDAPLVAYVAAAGRAWLDGDPGQSLRLQAQAASRFDVDALAADGVALAADLADMRGDAHLGRGDLEQGLAAYHDVAVIGARRGDQVLEAWGLGNEILARAYTGRPAEEQLDRAVALASASGNPSALAFVRYAEGEAYVESDPPRALAVFEEAHRLADSVGNRLVAGLALTASVALRGRWAPLEPATFQLFRRVVRHWTASRNQILLVTALRNLVVLLERAEDDTGAVELWSAVEALDDHHASFGAEAQRLQRVLAAARGRLGSPAVEAAGHRGRSRHDLPSVSALAVDLCDRHAASTAAVPG